MKTSWTNAFSNIIASGAGALGGLAVGGGNSSINALSGAATASAIQQYNQAAEQREDMKQREHDILVSDPEVKKLLMTSPTAQKEIESLESQGWKIVSSDSGGGYTNYEQKKIFISPDVSTTTPSEVSTISHELGHAMHPTEYDYTSKDIFISKALDGEGWATINNIIIANEINKNITDPYDRISLPGNQGKYYDGLYQKYGSTFEGAHQIGEWYGNHERTSVDGKLYHDYYGDGFEHNILHVQGHK